MSQVTVNTINELLSGPIFNNGLPRPTGTNTCYINSLMIALRCMLNFLRLVFDSRLYFYFNEFPNENDVLFGMHLLIKAMVAGNGAIVNEVITRRRRELINILSSYSDRSVNVAPDLRPIPPNNATGDPMELLAYLKDWLQQSCQRIMDRDAGQQPTVEKRRACEQAYVVAQRLYSMLGDDLLPHMTDVNRCQNGHISQNQIKQFIQINLHRRFLSLTNALDDFFKQEEIEKRCAQCGDINVRARKGLRLEQFPEKILVLGLTFGHLNNRQIERTRIPLLDDIISLASYFNANRSIFGLTHERPLPNGEFSYELRSIIVRHGYDQQNAHYTSKDKLFTNLDS